MLNEGKSIVEAEFEYLTISDVALVWAKCDDDRIRGFLVERGMDGFHTPKIEGKFSLRPSITGKRTFSVRSAYVVQRLGG